MLVPKIGTSTDGHKQVGPGSLHPPLVSSKRGCQPSESAATCRSIPYRYPDSRPPALSPFFFFSSPCIPLINPPEAAICSCLPRCGFRRRQPSSHLSSFCWPLPLFDPSVLRIWVEHPRGTKLEDGACLRFAQDPADTGDSAFRLAFRSQVLLSGPPSHSPDYHHYCHRPRSHPQGPLHRDLAIGLSLAHRLEHAKTLETIRYSSRQSRRMTTRSNTKIP